MDYKNWVNLGTVEADVDTQALSLQWPTTDFLMICWKCTGLTGSVPSGRLFFTSGLESFNTDQNMYYAYRPHYTTGQQWQDYLLYPYPWAVILDDSSAIGEPFIQANAGFIQSTPSAGTMYIKSPPSAGASPKSVTSRHITATYKFPTFASTTHWYNWSNVTYNDIMSFSGNGGGYAYFTMNRVSMLVFDEGGGSGCQMKAGSGFTVFGCNISSST